MDTPIEVTLRNGILKPTTILLNVSSPESTNTPTILLKIANEKSQSLSDVLQPRKYIFMIEELDQETGSLSPGDEHLFKCFNQCQNGKYHLTCINYPKLNCEIQIVNQQLAVANERKSNTIINLSGLEAVEEKQQQNKEDFGKQENSQAKSDEVKSVEIEDKKNQNPFGTPNKAQIQDFDKMLESQKSIQQTIENRYLRYFQEQFRIWRNFFEEKEKQQSQDIQICTPPKEKPKSEHRKNSDNNQESNVDSWSKAENYSPNLKFAYSCGSPENNENLSEFEKEKSELSNLRSHQDHYRVDEELEKQPKAMKKTNSQYRLNIQEMSQKRDSQAQTTSMSKQKKAKAKKFIQWLDSWAQNQQAIYIKQKDDEHITKQWLNHLKNKYKVAKFMYE